MIGKDYEVNCYKLFLEDGDINYIYMNVYVLNGSVFKCIISIIREINFWSIGSSWFLKEVKIMCFVKGCVKM